MEYYDLEKKKNVSTLLISGRGGDPSSEQTNDPDMKFWGLVHTSTASQWSFQLHTVTIIWQRDESFNNEKHPTFPCSDSILPYLLTAV